MAASGTSNIYAQLHGIQPKKLSPGNLQGVAPAPSKINQYTPSELRTVHAYAARVVNCCQLVQHPRVLGKCWVPQGICFGRSLSMSYGDSQDLVSRQPRGVSGALTQIRSVCCAMFTWRCMRIRPLCLMCIPSTEMVVWMFRIVVVTLPAATLLTCALSRGMSTRRGTCVPG